MANRFMKTEIAALTEAEQDIRAVRSVVFCEEQHVPPELEWDGKDSECTHVISRNDEGLPIGTGRLQMNGRIGRLAVLKEWRAQGIGRDLLKTLIESAITAGIKEVFLHSQVDAIAFYEKQGFKKTGDIFIEADIEHVTMTLSTGRAAD